MVLTRTEGKTAFTHVLDTVLGRGDGTPLKMALLAEGIDDIFSLVSLNENAINTLEYKDENDALKPIRLSDKMLLKCFLMYVFAKKNEGELLTDGWTKITQADFDEFRINPSFIANNTNIPITSSSTAPAKPAPPTALSFTPADIFCRGIKRDPTLFPTLCQDLLQKTQE